MRKRKMILTHLKAFHKNENGDIVQTAIIIAMLSIVAVGALLFLGPKIKENFDKAGEMLDDSHESTY